MGFDAGGEDPVGGMMKGVQDKFGNMTKSMNMPNMPGAPGQSTAPTQAPAKQDPKAMLKALPDTKLSTMSGDEARKMLADLKKMAGI